MNKINLITKKINNSLNKSLNKIPQISKIVKKINEVGGQSILVGGAVRDLLLGLSIKDLDIEVHNLTAQELENILKKFGPVNLVGKSFGVFRIYGLDIDWSLPRKDSSGRKPKVQIDPFMNFKEAFRRRDLTINAIGIDLTTKELIDPFNGYKDLKNKILNATDPKFFIEDPLRLFRVMQFIGRFNMTPDNKLNEICEAMHIKKVSVERIEQEFNKLFLKSEKPSLGIDWLRKINRLNEILPELAAIINIPQNPQWHPEGDVYEHTLQALDAAAKLPYDSDHERLIIMWSALCHDLGKAYTTEFKDGRYISHGHELVSEKLAKKLLKRITRNNDLIKTVSLLVKYHMQPGQLIAQNAKPPAYKRLAKKLEPYCNLQMLAKLFYADRAGRNPKKGNPILTKNKDVQKFINKINKLNISTMSEEPVLHGRDIIDIVKPGPQMGELLKLAYEIQIDKGIKDKTELKRKVIKYFKKKIEKSCI